MQPVQVTGGGTGRSGEGVGRGGAASREAAGRSRTSAERWLRHRSAQGAGPLADLAIWVPTCHCSLVRCSGALLPARPGARHVISRLQFCCPET